jgi:protein involved in polysaccharide export with SLBB domain
MTIQKMSVKLLVFTAFLFFSQVLQAQQNSLWEIRDLSTVKIDNYSDNDIAIFKTKIEGMRIEEDAAYEILKSKGLPQSEVAKLKMRMQKKGNKQAQYSSTIEQKDRQSNADNDSASLKMEESNKDMSIFGAELFSKNSLVFEPNLRIATPSSYVLGPDDEIVVHVYGYSEMKYNLEVNENGEIYIPNVGPLAVSGLTIQAANNKIKNKLAGTIYRAIATGQTKVQTNITKIRSIRVTVIGEAYKPGTYTVSSLTSLYNVLYLCGGPSNMGSYRSIELIRGGQVERTADLYDFLVKGQQKGNVLLQEGDVIRIPYYVNRVRITGNVKRTGKYEMLENETFNKLLEYCGGFNELAFRKSVTVARIGERERKVINVSADNFSQFKAQSGDDFFVNRLQDKLSDKVSVTGAVHRPGDYEAEEGLTLKALIEKAGGLSDDAYRSRVNVFRNEKGRTFSILAFDLDSVLNNQIIIGLKKSDSVHIYSLTDFKDRQFVSVQGNVRTSGLVTWRLHITVRDVLLESGGISEMGDSTSIEISRRKKIADFSQLQYNETETFLVNISSPGQDLELMPFDIVTVKVKPGVINQRTVVVLGDVKIPGKYNLQKSADRISDIIQRVGGFRPSADSSSLTIRRTRKSSMTLQEREMLFERLLNIDIDSMSTNQQLKNELYNGYDLITVDLGDILLNPSHAENLMLEDGDILSIDKNTKVVKVSGEVFFPTIIPMREHRSARYYIKQAGGFMSSSRKSKTLVIYPNGKVRSVHSFLGFRKFPRVTGRAEIFVPQKNMDNKNKMGTGEWALLVSALGILSNVIINAIK